MNTIPPEPSSDSRPKLPRIGEVVRQTRTRNGLTQEDLAEKARLDVRTVQRTEADRSSTRLPTLSLLAEALGTTSAALLEEARRLTEVREGGASPLDDPEFWAGHRRRDESLLAEVTDIRGLERVLQKRVQGYATTRTSPGEEGGQDPAERQREQKDFLMSLLMHSPVDADTQGGLATLQSLERGLAALRAKGNAVFAGETHYCNLVVAVVEDGPNDLGFIQEDGVRYYRADVDPGPGEEES